MLSKGLKGQRIGAGPMVPDRGYNEQEPRIRVEFHCGNGHTTYPSFASNISVPKTWDCPCGLVAGQDPNNLPVQPPVVLRKHTHLEYVRERRNEIDAEAILNEALAKLHAERS